MPGRGRVSIEAAGIALEGVSIAGHESCNTLSGCSRVGRPAGIVILDIIRSDVHNPSEAQHGAVGAAHRIQAC